MQELPHQSLRESEATASMQQRYQTFSREACQPSAPLSLSVCVTAPALPPVSLQSAPVAVVTLIGCIPLLFQILSTHETLWLAVVTSQCHPHLIIQRLICLLNLLWCKLLFSVMFLGQSTYFVILKICSANVTCWMLAFCKLQETLHRVYWLAANC